MVHIYLRNFLFKCTRQSKKEHESEIQGFEERTEKAYGWQFYVPLVVNGILSVLAVLNLATS
ncbi:MAG: hypothetical protein DCC55_26165 [Chloroflexi bacterium]|nr:MAG: hypothetical protein DCC55_26165 [Chloroflexota bacterium]